MATPAPAEEPRLGPPVDVIETVLLGVGRFRWWILPFALLGLAVGTTIALIEVNEYTSRAKLWVNLEDKSILEPEQNLGEGSRHSSGRSTLSMNEVLQFLYSPQFLDRIVKEVGPERLTEPYDPTRFDHPGTPKLTRWQHRLQDWWHNRNRPRDAQGNPLELNLDSEKGFAAAIRMMGPIIMRGQGNILNIVYNTRSPELAQDVVRAASHAAIERYETVFSGRVNLEFIDAQIDRFEVAEREASDELRRHQLDCGFYDVPDKEKKLLDEKDRIERLLYDNEILLAQVDAGLEDVKRALEELPEEVIEDVPTQMGTNPFWTQLNQLLAKARLDKDQLSLEFKGEFLKEREAKLQEEIDYLQAQLLITPPTQVLVEAHQKTVPNPDYVAAVKEQEKLTLEKDKLLITETNHKRRLDDIDDTLARLANCKPEHREMERVIAESRTNLGKFLGKRGEESLRETLDEGNLKNMFILEEAIYNPLKIGPKRGQTVLFGLVGGMLVGVAFTVLRQLLDSKLRYPMSVANSLKVPVLGVISEQKGWRRMGQRLQKEAARA